MLVSEVRVMMGLGLMAPRIFFCGDDIAVAGCQLIIR